MTRPAVAALRAEWEAGKLAGGHMSERTVQFVERLLAALEVPPTLTDAQAWELWAQLGSRDVSGFATKREVADWVRAVVGRYVRGEAPPEPTVDEVLALAERMPPDVFAAVEQGDFTLRMLLRIVAGQLGGWQARGGRGEAGPLPPEPDHFTAGDLVGVANIITDVDTYPSVEACARAVLERAVRDGLVRGGVPAPRSEITEVGVAAAWKAFCADWPYEVSARMYPALVKALCAYLASGVRAVPAPQEGPPGVAAYEGLLRAVDRGASAPVSTGESGAVESQVQA